MGCLSGESVRINALKRCQRLAEAVKDCCACSVFAIGDMVFLKLNGVALRTRMIPDLHPRTRETRAAVAGKLPPFAFAPVRSLPKVENGNG